MGRPVSDESAHLISDAKTLLNTVLSDVPQAQEAMSSDDPLPDGCSTKASMALFCLNGVEEKLGEFVATLAHLKESIRSGK